MKMIGSVKCKEPLQNMFGLISRELDCRHDKRERIVKISRDITIGRHIQYMHILGLAYLTTLRPVVV